MFPPDPKQPGISSAFAKSTASKPKKFVISDSDEELGSSPVKGTLSYYEAPALHWIIQ